MIVILLGSPGSGKGTQSRILSARHGFKYLATGDIFRAEMAAKTPLGIKAAGYVNVGKLVPDDVVTEMVAGRLSAAEADYLLDGFPRNLDQAKALSNLLLPSGRAVNLAVFLNLAKAEALRRLTGRRVCESCGEAFNAATRPPKTAQRCDKCGARLATREDDKEETAAKRLVVFEDLTRPLIAYYKAQGVLREIDAAQAPEAVAGELLSALDGLRVRN